MRQVEFILLCEDKHDTCLRSCEAILIQAEVEDLIQTREDQFLNDVREVMREYKCNYTLRDWVDVRCSSIGDIVDKALAEKGIHHMYLRVLPVYTYGYDVKDYK